MRSCDNSIINLLTFPKIVEWVTPAQGPNSCASGPRGLFGSGSEARWFSLFGAPWWCWLAVLPVSLWSFSQQHRCSRSQCWAVTGEFAALQVRVCQISAGHSLQGCSRRRPRAQSSLGLVEGRPALPCSRGPCDLLELCYLVRGSVRRSES